MKRAVLIATLLLLTVPVQADELSVEQSEAPAFAKPRMSVRQLKDHNVEIIGDLGLPLGTAADLTAWIVSAKQPGAVEKDDGEGRYLLMVTHVNRRPLPTPVKLEFRAHRFAKSTLANNSFELYELKKGRKTGSLGDAQRQEIEQGYLNRIVTVTAYEDGRFSGTPSNLRGAMWQDKGYHFENYLIVLEVHERAVSKSAQRARPRMAQSAR